MFRYYSALYDAQSIVDMFKSEHEKMLRHQVNISFYQKKPSLSINNKEQIWN